MRRKGIGGTREVVGPVINLLTTSSMTLPHWIPGQLAETGLQVLVEGQEDGSQPHPWGQDVAKGRSSDRQSP